MLLQILISGLAMGSIYGLVALGFVLLVNAADIINFAQGEFVMLGAFLVFTFTSLWGLPFGLSVLLVMLVMGLFGLAMERVSYRPLRNTNTVTIIVATLGISVFLQNVALRAWGSVPEYFGEPFGRQILTLGSLRLVPQHLLILVVTGALVALQRGLRTHLSELGLQSAIGFRLEKMAHRRGQWSIWVGNQQCKKS